jgi:hypothetical protein
MGEGWVLVNKESTDKRQRGAPGAGFAQAHGVAEGVGEGLFQVVEEGVGLQAGLEGG